VHADVPARVDDLAGCLPQDLRALAQPVKKGELFMWSVRVKADPKTGIPTPQTVFDSVNILVDDVQVTISDKVANHSSSLS
jgi:hypothetical protein